MDFAAFMEHVRDHPLIRNLDEWWGAFWEAHRQKIVRYGVSTLVVLGGAGWYASYRGAANRKALVELEQLEMLYQKGSFEIALTDAKNYVAAHGGTKYGGLGYYYLGNCQFHTRRYDEAKVSFEQALKKWLPGPVRGYADLATPQILEAQGDYQKAIEAYREAMKKPACEFLKPEILTGIARCFEQMGQWQSAIDTYQEIVQSFRGSPWEQRARDATAALETKISSPPMPSPR